jgi:hypothetical protein
VLCGSGNADCVVFFKVVSILCPSPLNKFLT